MYDVKSCNYAALCTTCCTISFGTKLYADVVNTEVPSMH